MLQAIEVVIEKDGTVRFSETWRPPCTMRAVMILLEPMNKRPKRPLHSFIGTLKHSTAFSADPVVLQRAMRNEWD